MTFGEIVLFVLSFVAMLIGLSGIFLPVLPGLQLTFAAFLLYGILTGFASITVEAVLIFFVIVIFSMALDYLAIRIGVKKLGGTRLGIIGAFVGSLPGLFLAGPLGMLVGAFAGAVLFEYVGGRGKHFAFKAGLGTLVGFFGGALIKFVIGVSIVIFFVYEVFST